ncbi:MAG: CTP synthase [Spirochaetes bacterium]|nr:CTP synthase [Spirochaetota bacterium]
MKTNKKDSPTTSFEQKKYIFVTGGVCSSLGKGVTASSVGLLLQSCGYKINMMKVDPYLNVDAGTMSPYQHGEVYVTNDGAETDLDLGNYERYVHVKTTQANSLTTGQVYRSVIEAERRGDYLGKTVQVIPHITDEIKRRIRICDEGKNSDIIIVEIGGTVGDIEGLPFIEAIRQFAVEEGSNHVKFLHLTLVPVIKVSGELKTKPTQHSVKELMSLGIQPNFLFCRTDNYLTDELKEKIGLFCNIDGSCIFSAVDVPKTIYEVPLVFHNQKADKIILEKLGLPYKKPNLAKWENIVSLFYSDLETVTIAMVGKYVTYDDTYKSVDAALVHGGIANHVRVKIIKIDSEDFEMEIFDKASGMLKRVSIDYFENTLLQKIESPEDAAFIKSVYEKDANKNCLHLSDSLKESDKKRVRDILKKINFHGLISDNIDGILVPGGFGNRGVEGKIRAINHARMQKIPMFGICLGLQCMVIEYARNRCDLASAHSSEFMPNAEHKVIELLANLKGIKYMGGTMRLGAQKSLIKKNTVAHSIYNADVIEERHRHRYEVNPEYTERIAGGGLTLSALSENGLVEIVELKDHPWYVGVQFHPEFQSSPVEPHPLFVSFINAAHALRNKKSAKKA